MPARRLARGILGLAAWVGLGATACVPGPAGAAFELDRGVVVAPARDAAYVMAPGGGIDAVSLATGETRWHSEVGAVPLWLEGDVLYAQFEHPGARGALRIVGIPLDDPGGVAFQANVPLSADAVPRVDDGLGSRFRAAARVRDGALYVFWSYQGLPVTGIDPGPRAVRTADGAARVDLSTGEVTAAADPPLANPLWPVPAPAPPAGAEPGGRPVAKRVSGDGRHLLVVHRVPIPERPFEPYVWSIYELGRDERIATLRTHASAQPFFLRGAGELVHVRSAYALGLGESARSGPLALRSVDTATGAERWQHPIRPTRYTGPAPPR